MDEQDSAPVAVVTGAGRGIGAAVARLLAASGWRLVLVDRCADEPMLTYPLATEEELDAVAADCGGAGHAVACVGDVRSIADLCGAVDTAIAAFGGLDGAVAVAGVLHGGRTVWEEDDATWDVLVDVNVRGVWNLARAAIPAMLARPEPRHGRFVAVASVAGLQGMPLLAVYNASKSAVVGLVRGIAADLGASGITANTVCPGTTRTALLAPSAAVYGLEDPEEFAVHHQIQRLLEPDEVAAAVAWLCSESASGLTGAAVPVDGGMTA